MKEREPETAIIPNLAKIEALPVRTKLLPFHPCFPDVLADFEHGALLLLKHGPHAPYRLAQLMNPNDRPCLSCLILSLSRKLSFLNSEHQVNHPFKLLWLLGKQIMTCLSVLHQTRSNHKRVRVRYHRGLTRLKIRQKHLKLLGGFADPKVEFFHPGDHLQERFLRISQKSESSEVKYSFFFLSMAHLL